MLTFDQRQGVVAEAMSWIGTPYLSHACLKGLGCDCATFILGVYQQAGLVMAELKLGNYNIEVFLHKEDTQYLDTVLQFADEIQEQEVLPGDVVLYKVCRGWHHGAIAIRWPETIIHAKNPGGVIFSHGTNEYFTKRRDKRFFRLK